MPPTWKKILLEGDSIPASDVTAGEFPGAGYSFAGPISVDTINEGTTGEGVSVDSVNLKDRTAAADAIILDPITTPDAAQSGLVRLPNLGAVASRNAANDDDVELIKLNADDEIEFGALLAREGVADGLATLDANGKVPTAQLPSGGGGHVIQDEGVALTQRDNIDFVGAGVAVTDDAVNGKTVVTIPGGDVSSSHDHDGGDGAPIPEGGLADGAVTSRKSNLSYHEHSVSANESTTSSSYTDLPTAGPSITPTPGLDSCEWIILYRAVLPGSGYDSRVAPEIRDPLDNVILTPSDNYALSGLSSYDFRAFGWYTRANTPSGSTVALKYRSTGVSCKASNRTMTAFVI